MINDINPASTEWLNERYGKITAKQRAGWSQSRCKTIDLFDEEDVIKPTLQDFCVVFGCTYCQYDSVTGVIKGRRRGEWFEADELDLNVFLKYIEEW